MQKDKSETDKKSQGIHTCTAKEPESQLLPYAQLNFKLSNNIDHNNNKNNNNRKQLLTQAVSNKLQPTKHSTE